MELLLILKINFKVFYKRLLRCFTKDYDNLDKEIDLNIINQYENL